jgi:hypothetical protein
VKDPLAPTPLALISFDIPPPQTADHTALELLSAVLTSGASSRLQKLLVDDKKLASMAMMQPGFPWATYGPSQLVGLLIASKDTKLADLRAAFWAELERVRKDGVTRGGDLERARSQAVQAARRYPRQTPCTRRCSWPPTRLLRRRREVRRRPQALRRVLPGDLKRVANQYLGQPSSVTFDIVPGQVLRTQKPCPALVTSTRVLAFVVRHRRHQRGGSKPPEPSRPEPALVGETPAQKAEARDQKAQEAAAKRAQLAALPPLPGVRRRRARSSSRSRRSRRWPTGSSWSCSRTTRSRGCASA